MGTVATSPIVTVMEPSTPEGVEHLYDAGREAGRRVMEPSTPEGVEHATARGRRTSTSSVMEPSTPEGVEHTTIREIRLPEAC